MMMVVMTMMMMMMMTMMMMTTTTMTMTATMLMMTTTTMTMTTTTTMMMMTIMMILMVHMYIYISKVHRHGISKIRSPAAIPARSNVRVAAIMLVQIQLEKLVFFACPQWTHEFLHGVGRTRIQRIANPPTIGPRWCFHVPYFVPG